MLLATGRFAAMGRVAHGAGMDCERAPGATEGPPCEQLIDLGNCARAAPAALPPCRFEFPAPRGKDGFVGFGGDLAPETIVGAYRSGAFPWPQDGIDELWFSPLSRAVIPVNGLHISRRLHRTLRTGRFRVSLDAAFGEVIRCCAEREEGTWITPAITSAYCQLHELGWAHSFEVWTGEGALVGGLYGLAVGAMFGAESMFHRMSDASKVAMVALTEHARRIGIELIDIQVLTEHTERMGAVVMPRATYLSRLAQALTREVDWCG